MADQIEREIDNEVGVFSSKKAAKVNLDVDLFGSPPSSLTKPPKKKEDNLFRDDLFSSAPKPATKSPATRKKASSVEDDLFSNKPTTGKKKTAEEDGLFDKPPEDIFASGSSKEKVETEDIFAPSKGNQETKNLDDIFADAPKKRASQKTKKEAENKAAQEEVDGVSL